MEEEEEGEQAWGKLEYSIFKTVNKLSHTVSSKPEVAVHRRYSN
jgi:hypothetical protein